MIPENELRVGVYVNYLGKPVKVNLGLFTHELDPIPLTPEILRDLGFFKWNIYPIIEDDNGIKYFEYTINGNTFKTMVLIQHLHQLQNLYFALTGTELEINLNP